MGWSWTLNSERLTYARRLVAALQAELAVLPLVGPVRRASVYADQLAGLLEEEEAGRLRPPSSRVPDRAALQEAADLLASALCDLDFVPPSKRLARARERLLKALVLLKALEKR
jgi:hypothetical protein